MLDFCMEIHLLIKSWNISVCQRNDISMIETSHQRCNEADEISDEASNVDDKAGKTDQEADVANDGNEDTGNEADDVDNEVSNT